MIRNSFFNRKGGVGKTTTTVNLASVLAKVFGKRVLVVDCDSQHSSSKYLSAYTGLPEHTVADVLNGFPIKDAIVPVCIAKNMNQEELTYTGIDLLASSIELDNMQIDDVMTLSRILDEVEEDYDYCLLDLPTQMGGLLINSLVASNYVIVPSTPTTDSIEGYDLLIDVVHKIRGNSWNVGLSVLGLLINCYDTRVGVQRYIYEQTMENMGDIPFKTAIKERASVENARAFGLPIAFYGDSKMTKDYVSLVEEIMERIEKTERGIINHG